MNTTFFFNILFCGIISTAAIAQTAPANNNPADAITLTISADSCSDKTAGTTIDATNSGEGGTPNCGYDLTSDVWYKAVIPESGKLTIETFSESYFDTVLVAYTGTPGNLTEVSCGDEGSSSRGLSKLVFVGETPGDTLYIRVLGSIIQSNFEICATSPFSYALYDDPTNPKFLLISYSPCSDSTVLQNSNMNASYSGYGGTPSCGYGINADIWYEVTIPSTGIVAIETGAIEGVDPIDTVVTAYTGTSDNLTQVGCADDGAADDYFSKLLLTDLEPNETLFIQVWGNDGNRGAYELCVWSPLTAFAANDNPADAVTLPVDTGACSQKVDGSLVDASISGVETPSCGYGISSDVWYKAVVPSSGNLAVETSRDGYSFDSVLTVYSGTPGNLTEVGCNDDGDDRPLSTVVLTGQTAGTTLYFRVWGRSGDRQPFKICAWEPTDIVANNDPADAISLTVGTDGCSGATAGSIETSSNSGDGGPLSCGDTANSDVWYKVVVPTSGNLTVETFDPNDEYFDSILTAYSGTPGNLTEVGCADGGGSDALSKLVLTGQTSGDTLYIRMGVYESDQPSFEICAWELGAIVANNEPADAVSLTVGSGSCSGNTEGTTENATTSDYSSGASTCAGDDAIDVWYKAVVPTSGNLTVEIFDEAENGFDSVLTIYSGTPDNLTEVNCNDDNGNGVVSKLELTGQTAGNTLYIQVSEYFNDELPFEICAWDPMPLSVDAIGLASLTVYPNPATNTLHIDTKTTLEKVDVYTLIGKKVLSVSGNASDLDVSALPTGLYVLRVSHDTGRNYVKFLKE